MCVGAASTLRRCLTAALLGTSALAAPPPALAEVATDGTLGRRVRLTGPDVEVGAELGRVAGRNLFHSFERFGVERGGRVTFTGPGGLDNVVSRVTGGEASRIDGTLASRVGRAAVWLVNPAGIVFGPGARLDVPGSFHASTADEVRFPDGSAFSAVDPAGSSLSVARPEAFGFLGGGRPGGITVDRGVLAVPAGEALLLAGGDIQVRGNRGSLPDPDLSVGGTLRTRGDTGTPGTLRAPAGRVTLSALSGPGSVSAATGEAAGAASGEIRLIEGATVSTAGDGGGLVSVRGGDLTLEGTSEIFSGNTGSLDAAGGVLVEAGDVTLVGGSSVTANAYGTGRAGDVTVRTGRLLVDAQGSEYLTGIASDAEAGGTGDGGTVSVVARDASIRAAGVIRGQTLGAGDAGTVDVAADRMRISGGVASLEPFYPYSSGIIGYADTGSTGEGARIRVAARELELVGAGAVISASSFGEGGGGDVSVTAERLVLDRRDTESPFGTGIDSKTFPPSLGDAGSVTVVADELAVLGGAEITSGTNTRGDAGNVTVRAGRLLLAGDPELGGNLLPRLGVANSAISSDAFPTSTGDAGSVTVEAGELEVRDGASISSSSFAAGVAGDVVVRTRRATVRDEGLVRSTGQGTGPAGDVRVEADTLLVEGGTIGTFGTGAEGGRIEIRAEDLIALDRGEVTSNGIQAAGGASLITLRAPLIALLAGSRVTSLTGEGVPIRGSGEARLLGDLTFISDDSEVLGSSTVELVGIDNEVGSGLQLAPGAFLDAGSLLGQSCAVTRAGRLSTFARAGRGSLPPSPDRPLASTEPARASPSALVPGPLLLAATGCGY
jgi:filamentous hemagglutinin family protein